MRDRLIELMKNLQVPMSNAYPTKVSLRHFVSDYNIERIADHLLDNGIIVPPCKVGDIFYGVNETSYDAYCVVGFKWGKRRGDDENVLLVLTVYEMEFVWGEEAFLTREEAERALKGGVQE